MTLVHRMPHIQLMGTNEIEGLQRALTNLSVATQRPSINTKITGVVDDGTMASISEALGLLTQELPQWLYFGLQGVMIIGVTNATAKQYVGKYAPQLTLAANAAAVKFKTAPVVVPPVTTTVGIFAPGWYKTPIGIVIIAVGALVGIKIISVIRQPPARRAAA
jgi:hypothetical protein